MSSDAVRRFSRQIILKEVGAAGLKAWLSSPVAVHGDGVAADLTRRYVHGAGLPRGSDPAVCPSVEVSDGLAGAMQGVGDAGALMLSLLPGGAPVSFESPPMPAVSAAGDPLVAIVGVGGLGCPAAVGLALGGVRRFRLIDDDVVDISNLPRQILHRDGDVGRAKVDSGRDGLLRWFPDLAIETHKERLVGGNAARLLDGADLVIEGSDNFPTKFRVNAFSKAMGVPAVVSGVLRLDGQALALMPGADTACYRCLFPKSPAPGEVPTCSSAGILGPVAGVLGLWEAALGLQLLAGEDPSGKLWTFDARGGRWMGFGVRRVDGCVACGAEADDPALRDAAEGEGPMAGCKI
ncbi:MAG: HesA/MoeB/ThiF family protein [Proteobacteria bacterium]|nr:HesA/MoeB/ThiF family protein [Pseudomonadota bacterium]